MKTKLTPGAIGAVITTLLLFSLLLAGCNGDGPGTTGESMATGGSTSAALDDAINDEPIDSDRVTLVVYGMSCPLCATNVDKQLLRLPGVEDVDVDLDSGRIEIQFDEASPTTRRQIRDAVVDSGFTFVRFEEQ